MHPKDISYLFAAKFFYLMKTNNFFCGHVTSKIPRPSSSFLPTHFVSG